MGRDDLPESQRNGLKSVLCVGLGFGVWSLEYLTYI
jgi:hypothetical protein